MHVTALSLDSEAAAAAAASAALTADASMAAPALILHGPGSISASSSAASTRGAARRPKSELADTPQSSAELKATVPCRDFAKGRERTHALASQVKCSYCQAMGHELPSCWMTRVCPRVG